MGFVVAAALNAIGVIAMQREKNVKSREQTLPCHPVDEHTWMIYSFFFLRLFCDNLNCNKDNDAKKRTNERYSEQIVVGMRSKRIQDDVGACSRRGLITKETVPIIMQEIIEAKITSGTPRTEHQEQRTRKGEKKLLFFLVLLFLLINPDVLNFELIFHQKPVALYCRHKILLQTFSRSFVLYWTF